MSIEILISDSVDPWFNLAVEDWIFLDRHDVDHILFLWRNADTVVIGRSQNPWLECHLEKMQQDKVKLARRQSGGGAVFHDLGNTNFTFMSKKNAYDKQANIEIILSALSSLGVTATAQGRNDLVVEVNNEQRKISGSAYKEKVDRCFHHGTMLISTDLTRLAQYLNPNKLKLKAKGVKSIRSRVANIADIVPNINHERLSQAIIDSFQARYQQSCEPLIINQQSIEHESSLQQRYQNLSSWSWLYGQTLPFTHRLEARFEWATVDLRLDVSNAKVHAAQFFTDCLDVPFVLLIEEKIVGLKYQHDTIKAFFLNLSQSHPEFLIYCQDLCALMVNEIKVN